ncbi:MAG: outer membrane protein assembly factor BamB family protein [Planctomycetota bacterium]|jgi:outer membrane protein assembly factor BamB
MKRAVVFLSWLVVALPCAGDIIIVDDDWPADFNNIQAAIDDSNDGDIIYVFPGTYRGTGNFNIDYGGRAITVTGVDPQDPYIVAATVVDCNGAGRGFNFHSAEDGNSIVAGLTIANGYADYGGGIRCNYSSPTISNCIIRENSADYGGGGVYCYSSDPTITGCAIGGNCSNRDGGGMYCEHGSMPNISNCEFVENSASRWGGGMYAGGGVPKLTACAFYSNAAENGGGIYSNESDPDLESCTLTGNTAGVSGGGLYCDESGPIVSNCTFSSNVAEAGFGGGILSYYAWVRNSILWDNNDSGASIESAQISGATSQVCFSCIQDEDPNDANIPFGGADNNNIDDYPLFVREPDDGGDRWGDDPCTPEVDEGANDDYGDLHLESGSLCINAGEPFARVGPDGVDMDGEPRVMGPVVDMGADEYFMKMLAVTEPEGGEVWTCHSWHQIVWVSDLYEGNVDIVFSANDGDSNECVIAVVPSVADPNVICIESGLFTIHPDAPGPAVTSKWESLGGDYDRKGLSENYGPQLGCIKWEFEVDGAISASVTIGPNETVYAPCEDGNLYKLDSNGMVLWSYEANSPLISAPSIGPDGTVYVGAENGRLYAVDVNGNLRWTHSTGGMVYSSPAVSADGNNIYVGSQDGRLYALGRDGSELWSFETQGLDVTSGAILSSPAIGPDGTVYVGGSYDANLYALDPNNGSVKWVCHFDSNGWPFASPVVAADGTIYQVLVHDSNLYAIEPNDGSVRWATNLSEIIRGLYSPWFEPYYYFDRSFEIYVYWYEGLLCGYIYWDAVYNLGDSGWSEPALGPDGTIYVSLEDPWLRAVEPNGAIKWIKKPGPRSKYTEDCGQWGCGWYSNSSGPMGSSLTVGSDGFIYMAGNDSNLYVMDPCGFEIARFESNGYWLGFPVVSADSTLILGDSRDNSMLISYENNRLWAIGEDCQGQEPNLYWQGGVEDLDGDGAVDYIDFACLAGNWLRCTDCDNLEECGYGPRIPIIDEDYLIGDINRDRYVDFLDVAVLVERWLDGH